MNFNSINLVDHKLIDKTLEYILKKHWTLYCFRLHGCKIQLNAQLIEPEITVQGGGGGGGSAWHVARGANCHAMTSSTQQVLNALDDKKIRKGCLLIGIHTGS